ncbi:MAG TPA: hypothetical protein VHP31_08595 [Caproicibacter sp.]|nr:hypothetical protein [Caproicibacter sp.]
MKRIAVYAMCVFVFLSLCSCSNQQGGKNNLVSHTSSAATSEAVVNSDSSTNESKTKVSESSAQTTQNPLLDDSAVLRQLSDYSISAPKGWVISGQSFAEEPQCGPASIYAGGDTTSNGFKACSSLDTIIDACKDNLSSQIDRNKKPVPTVETQKKAKINNRELLIATGTLNNDKFLGYYYLAPADDYVDSPHPVYWVFVTHSASELPQLQKYGDAMASTLQIDTSVD